MVALSNIAGCRFGLERNSKYRALDWLEGAGLISVERRLGTTSELMGRKRVSGLILRAGVWHIDKHLFGRRICESTGTARLEEAERHLARVMEVARQAQVYGVRPARTFEQAAAKFVLENQHKRSISDDVRLLKGLMPWIGSMPLDKVHMGTLQPWLAERRRLGRSDGTINNGLQVVRRILNLAAGEWIDEQGLTWLAVPAKIKLMATPSRRQPYPLSWDEQARLFAELPAHLAQMGLFAVNTGCRDAEICGLRWDWEVEVPALGTSVFIIPAARVKNGDDRLVVLNSVARSVVQARRGSHATYVFSYEGLPMRRMLTSAWKRARQRAGLPLARVHDLKHTFGRRLRPAGVGFEDRAELSRLIEAGERVTVRDGTRPQLVVLRGAIGMGSRKSRKTSASTEGGVRGAL
jgi:integrase